MPLSTNAPFSEFGQSMILRDIEQLYLAMSQAGVGSAGEASTQDQTVGVSQDTGDGGGVPDLSGLATIDYVDALANQILDSIPTITYPISIANGGTGQTTATSALAAMRGSFNNVSLITSGTTWTIPAGATRCAFVLIGGGGGGNDTASDDTIGHIASSSGGSPTTPLVLYIRGSGGGGGAIMTCAFDTTPGQTVAITIGSGGALNANGGTTILSYLSVVFEARGGAGGTYPGLARGGNTLASIADMSLRPFFCGSNGMPSSPAIYNSDTSDPAFGSSGGLGFEMSSSLRYGEGGLGGISPSGGSAGCILAFY